MTAIPCVACGGAMRPWLDMPIDAKTFAATSFGRVSRCEHCGHGSAAPLPRPEDVPLFYALEKYYTQGTSHIPYVTPRLHDRILTRLAWMCDEGVDLKRALQALELRSHSTVCEIGCGHAGYLALLKAEGHMTIGVDPDPKAVAQAIAIGIEVLPGTAEVLPEKIQCSRFDLVIMSHSLEHCIDPGLAVRNVRSILRPGGTFVCEVPNCGCTHFQWNNICSEMFDAPRHLHFFNAASLHASIESAGMTVRAVQYTGFTRHHSPGWRLTEQRIHDNLKRVVSRAPAKHTFWKSLLLLMATIGAAPSKKYDSVRIIATRPSTPSK